MEFEAVNVEGSPAALAELHRLGAPLVPAVAVGERVVHGWNPSGVAELVGVKYRAIERLTPGELIRRLDTILSAAQRAIRQVPPDRLGTKSPDRDRTVRQLGYHLFRLSLAIRDGLEQGRFPEEWLQEEAPPEIADGDDIARYGQTVRERLTERLGRAGGWEREVRTYYGPQTAHELLERTVWHAAQHLRQLYALLEGMGVTPEAPLTEADFRGLPLPKAVW